jgi:Tfp pilus assembly protein PilF
LHRYIRFFVIGFAVVIAISFGAAVYLRTRQNVRADNPRTVSSPAGIQNLLEDGQTFLQKGKVEQALISYRKALSIDPSSIQAQLGVADGELAAGREQLAAREYDNALRIDSGNTKAMLESAKIYSRSRATWRLSETRFKEYLGRHPNDAGVELQLGRVLSWQDKPAAAAGIFARESVQKRMTREDWRLFAFALADSQQTEEAERRIREILARDPKDREMRVRLAGIYTSQRQWDKAAPMYRTFLNETPDDPKLNQDYGLMLVAMKDYRGALDPLKKASSAMPDSGEAVLAYARALKGVGDSRQASREYERALPRNPENAAVVREYADLLLERRDFRKSVTYYKRAQGMGISDQRLLLGLAGALSGDQKYKEALTYMEQAHQNEPTEFTTLELAKLLHKVGERDRALRLLDSIDKRQNARRE